jgi:hypothetical protein
MLTLQAAASSALQALPARQMQQQQAALEQVSTQEQQAVQQQGRALLHLPARRRAALAASPLLQQLLLMMQQAVLRLPSPLQQLQEVVRVGRGRLARLALVAHFVILGVVAWVLPRLRSMHANLTATTAWTCHSPQTDRWVLAAATILAQQHSSDLETENMQCCAVRHLHLHTVGLAHACPKNAVHRSQDMFLPACCAVLRCLAGCC